MRASPRCSLPPDRRATARRVAPILAKSRAWCGALEFVPIGNKSPDDGPCRGCGGLLTSVSTAVSAQGRSSKWSAVTPVASRDWAVGADLWSRERLAVRDHRLPVAGLWLFISEGLATRASARTAASRLWANGRSLNGDGFFPRPPRRVATDRADGTGLFGRSDCAESGACNRRPSLRLC